MSFAGKVKENLKANFEVIPPENREKVVIRSWEDLKKLDEKTKRENWKRWYEIGKHKYQPVFIFQAQLSPHDDPASKPEELELSLFEGDVLGVTENNRSTYLYQNIRIEPRFEQKSTRAKEKSPPSYTLSSAVMGLLTGGITGAIVGAQIGMLGDSAASGDHHNDILCGYNLRATFPGGDYPTNIYIPYQEPIESFLHLYEWLKLRSGSFLYLMNQSQSVLDNPPASARKFYEKTVH
jgi:hypothetical protein